MADAQAVHRAFAITISVFAGWVIGLRLAPNVPPYGNVLLPAVILGGACGLLRRGNLRVKASWVAIHWLATMVVGFITFRYVGDRDALLVIELAIPALPIVLGHHLADPYLDSFFGEGPDGDWD